MYIGQIQPNSYVIRLDERRQKKRIIDFTLGKINLFPNLSTAQKSSHFQLKIHSDCTATFLFFLIFVWLLSTFDTVLRIPKGNFHLAWKFRSFSSPKFFPSSFDFCCDFNLHATTATCNVIHWPLYNILASFLFHYRIFFPFGSYIFLEHFPFFLSLVIFY